MLFLRILAPFAAFRSFTAGSYRSTAAFLTPSAAYGLVLNIAGIETRRDDGLSDMTVTRFGLPLARIALEPDQIGSLDDEYLPRARIALGADPAWPLPTIQSLFQQLHDYPVGASGKDRKDDTKGNKYHIAPVRREFLSGLRAIMALEFTDHPEIEDRICSHLTGGASQGESRYGLPFLGDNAFLIDKIEVQDAPIPARWFRRIDADSESGAIPDSTRLTSWIDRQDMSRTRSDLYAPIDEATEEIPESAWTLIDPPASPEPAPRTPKQKG
jgi:CRISPR-associated protein Cas5t